MGMPGREGEGNVTCYISLNDHYSAREIQKVLQELDPNLAERLRKALR